MYRYLFESLLSLFLGIYIAQEVAAGWRTKCISVAESYPTSEVRDSGPECQAATVQERPGGTTPRPRSGAKAERSYPASEVSGGCEETPRV